MLIGWLLVLCVLVVFMFFCMFYFVPFDILPEYECDAMLVNDSYAWGWVRGKVIMYRAVLVQVEYPSNIKVHRLPQKNTFFLTTLDYLIHSTVLYPCSFDASNCTRRYAVLNTFEYLIGRSWQEHGK